MDLWTSQRGHLGTYLPPVTALFNAIQSTVGHGRIVNKTECALRCVNSVLKNMENLEDVDYHIIDDRSSEYFRDSLTKISVFLHMCII